MGTEILLCLTVKKKFFLFLPLILSLILGAASLLLALVYPGRDDLGLSFLILGFFSIYPIAGCCAGLGIGSLLRYFLKRKKN